MSVDVSLERPSPIAGMAIGEQPRLVVRDLSVRFSGPSGRVTAVENVDLDCRANEILALVGESGSGKSVTALSMIGLLPRNAEVSGSILLDGQELVGLPEREMSILRGSRISMIFQNPRASLNPCLTIASQMVEVIRRHAPSIGKREALDRAIAMLRRLTLRDPELQVARYPHQLSGGMCQRVALGIALLGSPRLLIADEPTTALDVIVQAHTLQLLREIHQRERIPIVVVTHDFGVVNAIASKVAVMYAGQIQESGSVDALLRRATHPYTRALLAAIPDTQHAGARLTQIDGMPPDPARFPTGCRFAPRCQDRAALCSQPPAFRPTAHGGMARCHFAASAG